MTHGYEFFEYDYFNLDAFDWDDFIGDYGGYEQSEISDEWAEIQDVYDEIMRDLW